MLERGRVLGCIRTDVPTLLLMQLLGAVDAVLDVQRLNRYFHKGWEPAAATAQ